MSIPRCRAQGGPAKCKDPRCPAKLAHEAQVAAFFAHPAHGAKAQLASQGTFASKAAQSQRALKSKLRWEGEVPKWWAGYVGQAQAHSDVACTPELLDVIDSPLGKLAVVWQHESFEKNDVVTTLDSGLGQNVCYYFSVETGARMGYLKLSHMDSQSFERSFGADEFTPFRFKERYGGHSFGLAPAWEDHTGDSSVNLSGEALLHRRRRLWLKAMRQRGGVYVNEKYVPSYWLEENHIPQDDEQIRLDLEQVAAEYRVEMEQKLRNTRDPYVEFARVNDHPELAGQGFGSALYIYAARRLGRDGKRLTASDVQSDDALGLWSNLRKNFPNRVKHTRKTYGFDYRRHTKTLEVLDFRVKKVA